MPARAGYTKKTYNLPPALVARAKRILGVRTETEAVVRALEGITFDDQILSAVKRAGSRLPGYQPLR